MGQDRTGHQGARAGRRAARGGRDQLTGPIELTTAPAGPAGMKVPVTVQTVESYLSGGGRGSTGAGFTYTH